MTRRVDAALTWAAFGVISTTIQAASVIGVALGGVTFFHVRDKNSSADPAALVTVLLELVVLCLVAVTAVLLAGTSRKRV